MSAVLPCRKEGSPTRLSWIDSWKGILILLVVLGHVVGGGAHLTSDESARNFCVSAYKVIYTFHMPAFFAVAGVVWKREEKPFSEFFQNRAFRLLVPYAVFGFFSVLVFLALESVFASARTAMADSYYDGMATRSFWQPFLSLVHAGGWPRGEGFRANGVLWFLPCFFSTQLLFWSFVRWVPASKWSECVGVILCLSVGFLSRYYSLQLLPWGIGKVPFFLAFMLAGYGFGQRVVALLEKHGRSWQCVFTLSAASVGYVWIVARFPDLSRAYCDPFWYVLYTGMAFPGILLGQAWGYILDSRVWALLGVYSLGIMLVHKFMVIAFQMKVPMVQNLFAAGVWTSVWATLFVTIFATAVALAVSMLCRMWCPWVLGLHRKQVAIGV